MSLPPMVLDVSIAPRGGRRRRLWLPLFLLWPLVLALALLGRRSSHHHCTGLLLRSLVALSETRGTAVSFSTATSAVDVTVA